ncbi:dihydropteroate synthase [Leekyejoonella antrihumi]|uniref:Dihydropteroate synthase n=1 Tax=Leekyejoonella antrihumi TaxID=1660198 RepID=A0A563E5L2_9MICO|nr:dihydropteroate synthase [Leekyejoonella antrihumi]TWP37858.1 dihydropteroate synthase [Leekyejoonella antrihumi]
MITLRGLAQLAADHADDLEHPVAPLRLGERVYDTDRQPVLMSVINLSQDSAYRESVAVSTQAAVRKAHVYAAEGAHLIDLGAESTIATAAAVDGQAQQRLLLPVIEQLVADDIAVSVETYEVPVAQSALEAGACVLNLTGSDHDDQMFTLAAEHRATVVLCHVLGPHARAITDADVSVDQLPQMIHVFERRIARARELGVTDLVIDPGVGFGYQLDDAKARAEYQAAALLHTFRLRRLGLPICHALPHAFDIFEDRFRSAEGVFAVLAHLGQTGVYRTHEVSLVRPVLEAMHCFRTQV